MKRKTIRRISDILNCSAAIMAALLMWPLYLVWLFSLWLNRKCEEDDNKLDYDTD